MSWQLQEAKSKFSQVVNQAIHEGPQIVTNHGHEVVVILSIDTYQKLTRNKPSWFDLLSEAPFAGSELEINRVD